MQNQLKKLFLYPYYSVRNSGSVKYFLDKRAVAAHYKSRPCLDAEQKRILDELDLKGIAFSSLDVLFGKNNSNEFLQYYENEKTKEAAKKTKSFLLATKSSSADLLSPLAKFSLDNKILDIANEYLGLWSIFRYAEYTETIPLKEGVKAKGSQNWHRDPGTGLICKAFIYLTDVDNIKDGPFLYIAGTHAKGKRKNIFPMNKYRKAGYMIPDKKIDGFLKDQNAYGDIVHAIGKAGTVIFADTLGIHRGGYTFTKPRIMTISLYEPPSSLGGMNYAPPLVSQVKSVFSPQAVYAVTKKVL